jgi:hypothetical protein
MATTFRVLGLATALTLGTALAASAQTNPSNPQVGTGLNGGVSHAVPGAGATTQKGVYPNQMPGNSAMQDNYRTGQNRVPGQGTTGMSTGDSGSTGSGTSGNGAGSGGGH